MNVLIENHRQEINNLANKLGINQKELDDIALECWSLPFIKIILKRIDDLERYNETQKLVKSIER